jgi:hypothetical protein
MESCSEFLERLLREDEEKLATGDYVECASCDTVIHTEDAHLGAYGALCEGCSEANTES